MELLSAVLPLLLTTTITTARAETSPDEISIRVGDHTFLPSGWPNVEGFYLHKMDEPHLDYYDAEAFCRRHNSQLATFNNCDEMAFLKDKANHSKSMWISAFPSNCYKCVRSPIMKANNALSDTNYSGKCFPFHMPSPYGDPTHPRRSCCINFGKGDNDFTRLWRGPCGEKLDSFICKLDPQMSLAELSTLSWQPNESSKQPMLAWREKFGRRRSHPTIIHIDTVGTTTPRPITKPTVGDQEGSGVPSSGGWGLFIFSCVTLLATILML